MASLESTSILYLLFELLKGGKAGVPELAAHEPIDLDRIIEALRQRTGMALGRDFEPWYRWYVQDYTLASENDRESLRLMKEMVEQRRYFVERFAGRTRKPQ